MHISSVASQPATAVFKGKTIHILDGGYHAENMEHYAKVIFKDVQTDINIKLHNVLINKNNPNLKQMNSLEEALKLLNTSGEIKKGDYVSISGLASVSLLNIEDRLRDVLGVKEHLTPQNIKSKKETILNLLRELYNYKSYYSAQIGYMDEASQNISYIWGVIQEINKMVQKGANVYVPAGHPEENSIKWLAGQKNKKEELYKSISHPSDICRKDVQTIIQEIRAHRWYDFNLLSLSEARVVNVKNIENKDYIFAAFDTCITDGARGVYNFYPVRNDRGEVIGYSYHDTKNIEYPYNEFPSNDKLKELNKFVGKNVSCCLASNSEHNLYKKTLAKGGNLSLLPDKLYMIKKIFSPKYIDAHKMNILGFLVNRNKNLIFDEVNGYLTFEKCNCEGSTRPSVLSMWGSCFATINAIKNDISAHIIAGESKNRSSYYIRKAEIDEQKEYYDGAEYYYNKALELLHPKKNSFEYDKKAIDVYEKLLEVLKKKKCNMKAEKDITNILIDLKCNEIKSMDIYSSTYMEEQKKIAKLYKDMAEYCRMESEYYPERVCEWAAEELEKGSSYGDKIVLRRAQQNAYIGDLYDEVNTD